jgi:dTDP-D-glucose 4,6-dehydratase
LAYAYWVEKKLETRTVRFFNTVGPRQLGAYGMVVPRFVQFALKNEPITIYGNGEQTRCFGHVLDAVDAVVRIAFAENTIGKVINIGNDYEISINDLAKKVIEQTNSKSEIVYVPYEEAYGDGFEDMERRVPNIDLINQLVGWKPKRDLTTIISDISEEMIKMSKNRFEDPQNDYLAIHGNKAKISPSELAPLGTKEWNLEKILKEDLDPARDLLRHELRQRDILYKEAPVPVPYIR